MFHVGKLAVRQVKIPVQPADSPPLASVPEEICCSSLIFLKDSLSDREFLVDSSTSVSVFPGPKASSDERVCLLTTDGAPMVCIGSCIIPLRFTCGSRSKVYNWNFQLAPVSIPLLKADFLQHLNLPWPQRTFPRQLSSLPLGCSSSCTFPLDSRTLAIPSNG